MPNELNFSLTYSANKPPTIQGAGDNFSIQQDMAGQNFKQATQTFTTTAAAIDLGQVANVGYVIIRNTAAANNLLVRPASGAADLAKIRPGGFAVFECNTNTPFAAASAGVVTADIAIFEL